MKEKIISERNVANINETQKFANEIVSHFKLGDTVLFYGNLGSGKTFLINMFVKIMGNNLEATSPSFSIINQYVGEVFINHLDFYRLKNKQELFNLGLDDIFNMKSINFIEWPQIMEEKIDWSHFRIYIEFDKKYESGRYIKLTKMII